MGSREQQFQEERSWHDWYSAFVQWPRFRDTIEAGEMKSVSDLCEEGENGARLPLPQPGDGSHPLTS